MHNGTDFFLVNVSVKNWTKFLKSPCDPKGVLNPVTVVIIHVVNLWSVWFSFDVGTSDGYSQSTHLS